MTFVLRLRGFSLVTGLGVLTLSSVCALLGCPSPALESLETPVPSSSTTTPAPIDAPPATVPKASLPGISVLPRDYDFSANPAVISRIAESPHHYFRFINPVFTLAVCLRYADEVKKEPRVGLHGDPHVEQFAVTDIGRGLADLDDASFGPPIVDLVRMGTSIILTVHEKAAVAGFSGHEADALATLFKGYRKGIAEPGLQLDASELDKRLRKKFKKTREDFLAFTDKSMLPFADPADEAEARDLHARWKKEMLDKIVVVGKNKSFPATYFDLKRVGLVKIGIGSGLDHRYLMRVEGPTHASDDDRVFEIKHERVPPKGSCAEPSRDYRPDRFVFSEMTDTVVMPIEIPDAPYWVGEWSANYNEVRIDKSLETYADFDAVVFASGFLLGREHLRSLRATGSPMTDGASLEAARARLQLDAASEKTMIEASQTMAKETEDAWARFRDAAAAK